MKIQTFILVFKTKNELATTKKKRRRNNKLKSIVS